MLHAVSFYGVVAFQEIIRLYPSAGDIFQRNKYRLMLISDPEFRKIKERLCLFVEFTSRTKDLDSRLRNTVAECASMEGYEVANNVLESGLGYFEALWSRTSDGNTALVQRTLQEANDAACNITDSRFFSEIIKADSIQKNKKLERSVQNANDLAKQYLISAVPGVVNKIVEVLKKIQAEGCMTKIKAETARYEDEELRKLRLQLIRHINCSTIQTRHP